MARNSLFQSVALVVLAAIGAMAAPAQAHPDDQEPDRQEARAARHEARAMQDEHDAETPRPVVVREAPRVAAPQEQTQPSEAGRTWNRGAGDGGGWQSRTEPRDAQVAMPERGSAPEAGWRSQRGRDGQRYGCGGQDDGAVRQPTPANSGETPRVPERDSADGLLHQHGGGADSAWARQRNRTYSDPNRSGTYGAAENHDHDRSAGSGRNRQGDRNAPYIYGSSASAYRDQNYGYQAGYGYGIRDYDRWDHNDWRRDTRHNWSGYRDQHRDLYRAGRYYSPYRNHGYSRLSIGFFLNSGFYGQRFWINDPWLNRLPAVYGPYRWVRYYDDVLVVDIYSGEVVDVIRDFFW